MNFFACHKDTFLWPPRFEQAWITAENVNKIFESVGMEGEVDLLSLDIDGMDYWVWKALDSIRARVVVRETHKGTTKNTGLPWKHRLRLMSWPASALANGRGNADFSWCPQYNS